MSRKNHRRIECGMLLIGLTVGATRVGHAQTARSMSEDRVARRADAAWNMIAIVMRSYLQPQDRNAYFGFRGGLADYLRWREARDRMFYDAGSEFCATYPDDTRCWQWLIRAMSNPPSYPVDIDQAIRAQSDTSIRTQIDTAAKAAWAKRVDELIAAGIHSPQVTVEQRAALYNYQITSRLRAVSLEAKQGASTDVASVERDVLDFAARFPTRVGGYEYARNQADAMLRWHQQFGTPASELAFLKAMAASPNADVSAMGRGRLRIAPLRTTPMLLDFTALDGRRVTAEALRGHVVMVDFWASTWCGVCAWELPHVKAVYAKYHALGFEIVGIALENNESDKAFLQGYVADKKMTWPQYFDGKGVDTKYAKQYGITAIPRHFFLNKEGLLVADVAAGMTAEQLETQVRRLLGLPDLTAISGAKVSAR